MATRGSFQLKELLLYYCEHGGSSRTLRDYIGTGRLSKWAASHPHVDIQVKVRNGHHPFVQGSYLTASSTHQICVKNSESWRDVQDVCEMLHNRSGRKITKITEPVLSDTPTIQGVWTPFLDTMAPFSVKIDER
jgi:large subunit ribosomal protein L43